MQLQTIEAHLQTIQNKVIKRLYLWLCIQGATKRNVSKYIGKFLATLECYFAGSGRNSPQTFELIQLTLIVLYKSKCTVVLQYHHI